MDGAHPQPLTIDAETGGYRGVGAGLALSVSSAATGAFGAHGTHHIKGPVVHAIP